MPSLEEILQEILERFPSERTRDSVEHILEAHRKLSELESGLRVCQPTSITEEAFRGLYNRFRRGRWED